MKKILVALCAVALIGLTGCKKDNVAPEEQTTANSGNTGGGSGGGTPATPLAKIARIDTNNVLYETWNWQDEQLVSINNGAGVEKTSFTYDNSGRVETMTVGGSDMLSGTMHVGYNSNGVSELSLVRNGVSIIVANLSYSAGKLSRADLDIDTVSLMTLFRAALPQILDSYYPGLGQMVSANMDGESTIDSIKAYMTFDWRSTNNVKFIKIEISARVNTTLGQIATLLNGNFSMFGQYASIVEAMATSNPEQEVHLNAVMTDKGNYEYDSHTNPFLHYLGHLIDIKDYLPSFNVATVSTNNTNTENHEGTAKVSVSTTIIEDIPFLGPMEVPVTIPVVNQEMYNTTTTYTYTYREGDGYPLTVTDNDGNTKTYTYQAK